MGCPECPRRTGEGHLVSLASRFNKHLTVQVPPGSIGYESTAQVGKCHCSKRESLDDNRIDELTHDTSRSQ